MKLFIIGLGLLMSATALADEHHIHQKDKKFDKAELTIKAGDTIVFHNDETDLTHNVFSLSDRNRFELKTQAPGSASSVPFKEVGVTEVECAIHTNMKIKVNVIR